MTLSAMDSGFRRNDGNAICRNEGSVISRNDGKTIFSALCAWLLALATLALVTAAPAALAADGAQTSAISVSPNLRIIPGEHNEAWVAVSATDPDIVLVAAQQGSGGSGKVAFTASTAISHDGGRSWAPVSLPNPAQTPFDVMVASGPDGRLYVMQGVIGGEFLEMMGIPGPKKASIYLYSSADGGWNWEGPTVLSGSVPQDHMRMTVDNSDGPHRGRIYVAWNDVADSFVRDQYEVFLQYSDDHGKSFTDPMLIDMRGDGKLVATEPVVLSDGTVLVTWYQYFNPIARRDNEKMPMFVARSTDGAKTFGKPEKIFEFGPHVWRDRVGAFSKAFTLPVVMADTSATSPHRDHIYITWDDVSGGMSNIWFVRSTNRGKTWSSPTQLNDNEGGSPLGVKDYRMTPVVAVSADGTVGVAWYDRRNDPNRMCWDYFASFSTDGGAHFGPNQRISTAPSCPPAGQPPYLNVHNLSPRLPDPNRKPDALLAKANTLERLYARIVDENQRAEDEANRGLSSARISVSFDPARNAWPGHYTGLTANLDGSFQAVWLDRRDGMQELYTARVVPQAPVAPRGLKTADITQQVEVIVGPPAFDGAKNTVKLTLQLRNVGEQAVYGPISLNLQGVAAASGFTTTLAFDGKLGTANLLGSRDLSETVTVEVPVKPEAGFDAAFDFTVAGSVAAQ